MQTMSIIKDTESSVPIQSITIYINMHGEDLIETPLPHSSHSFVSEIGKLGCHDIDLIKYDSDAHFCEKINYYKEVFQNKSIQEANLFLEENNIGLKNKFEGFEELNMFENPERIGNIKEKYTNDPEDVALHYHHGYLPSAYKTRVLEYDRQYSSIDANDVDNMDTTNESNVDTINDERKYMGIYIIETYNIVNPFINLLFNEFKTSEYNCKQQNFALYENIMKSYQLMDSESDKAEKNKEYRKNGILRSLRGFVNSIMASPIFFAPLYSEVEILEEDVPNYDVHHHQFRRIHGEKLNLINKYKMTLFKLSDILTFFGALGFKHVNIIDSSCRSVNEPDCLKGDCPSYMSNPENVRQISADEKRRGESFLSRRVGGIKRSIKQSIKRSISKRRMKTFKKTFKKK